MKPAVETPSLPGTFAATLAVLAYPGRPLVSAQKFTLLYALRYRTNQFLVDVVESEELSFSNEELDRLNNYVPFTTCGQRLPAGLWSRIGEPSFTRLLSARRKLEEDFRYEVTVGKILLEGVRVKPNLRSEAEPIPNDWATELEFDFFDNSITIGDHRFVAIRCWCRPPPSFSAFDTPGALLVPRDGVGAESRAARRPKGRENYEPLVEKFMRENWPRISAEAQLNPRKMPVATKEAESMRKKFEGLRRAGALLKVPSVNTMREHVTVVYARLLREKSAE